MFNTLQIYLGSLYVNDFNLFGRTFRVTIQADKDARAGATDLSRLYVRNKRAAAWCRSATLGTLKPIVGPRDRAALQQLRIRQDQRRGGARLQLGPGGRGDAARSPPVLPRDFTYEWTGITFQELKAGSAGEPDLRARDRLRVPDPRGSVRELDHAVHGAAGGAARPVRRAGMALFVRGMQIDVYSQIGFVMLIGLAAKNAILIVEFARRRREEGLSIAEAAMEAGRLRLRPILMTAFAFILGVLPLVVATGAGAASRQLARHHGVRRHVGRDRC